jgi:hypothetical protein
MHAAKPRFCATSLCAASRRTLWRWIAFASVTLSIIAAAPTASAQDSGNGSGNTPSRIVLPVRHIRQGTMLCVPTCASMVVTYYGEFHNQREIKALSMPPNNHYSGTCPPDQVQGMAEIGYQWAVAVASGQWLVIKKCDHPLASSASLGIFAMVPLDAHSVNVLNVPNLTGRGVSEVVRFYLRQMPPPARASLAGAMV